MSRGVCFAYQRGQCDREFCKFSHDVDAAAGEVPAPRSFAPRPTGVCYDFQNNGTCARGDSCRFRHDGGSGYVPRAPRAQGACYAFLEGHCERGDSCRFSHNVDASGAPVAAPARRPRGVCFTFQSTGTCPRGDSCIFSHDLSGAGGAPAPRPQGVCFEWQRTGACSRGESCKFAHA